MAEKTLQECKDNIQEFANRFKLIFEDEGECGFGRECVGLTNGSNYVEYNPLNSENYEYIKEFYDERFFEIVPEKAYHKHNCLAVLGQDEESIRQLSGWVDKLKELGAVVESYETGAKGVQALLSGFTNYAVRIPKAKRYKSHMAVNIEGFLRNYKRKKIDVMQDDNGRYMTDAEARHELAKLQAKGHKLLPTGDCEGFDPFGKGCPGHEIKEEEDEK